MIAGLVLAAGRAERFGAAKVLAMLHGRPLVRHVVDRLLAAGIHDITVTAGVHVGAIRDALEGTLARVVHVAGAESGMSASLRGGVEALPEACAAFVVALGDQPFIDPALVRQLEDAWRSSAPLAVVPVYRGGERGNPVLFDAALRPMLCALSGDVGARDLLRSLGDRVRWLAVDADAPRDVDTPADLDALVRAPDAAGPLGPAHSR